MKNESNINTKIKQKLRENLLCMCMWQRKVGKYKTKERNTVNNHCKPSECETVAE